MARSTHLEDRETGVLHSAGDLSAAWRPVISVDPVAGGWCVRGVCGEALMFLSGARAEDQARALAQRLASRGYETRVEIHDRANTLAGVIRYSAEQTLESMPQP